MGEYFYVANLDKKEYLHNHRFGGGLKLGEIALSGGCAAGALILLLAQGERRMGRWRGDRIVVVGDYDESGLYKECQETYRDISKEVVEELRAENWEDFTYSP